MGATKTQHSQEMVILNFKKRSDKCAGVRQKLYTLVVSLWERNLINCPEMIRDYMVIFT